MTIGRFPRLRVSIVAALTVALVATALPAALRVVAPARATTEPAEPGRWRSTGSMNTPRVGSVATLLSGPACATASPPDWCGRVLVTGGESDVGLPLASAEIYDPATGTWQLTGSMTSLHGPGHLAVLLGTGEVLVAGGHSGLNVAEIYDPVTGTWRRTATPEFGVYASGAALLPGGKVLVVAGDRDTPGRSQLFDPSDNQGRGSWVPTTPPGEWHPTPTVTILGGAACTRALLVPSCGKALVVGGASAELYDPATQVWQFAGVLPMPISARSLDCDTRPCHSATLFADGRVLVTGTQQLDTTGDVTESLPHVGAAVYDPAAGTWKEVAPMSKPRDGHPAVALPDGRVLVAGGAARTAEVYGPAESTAPPGAGLPGPTSTGPLLAPRSGHVLVVLADGRVLTAGGENGVVVTNSAEIFEPSALVQPPSVVGLDPPAAPAGDVKPTVTLTGAGLDGPGLTVEFGGVQLAPPASPASSTSLTVSAPARPPGRVPVRVTTTVGSSAITTETMFSYHEPISSLPGPDLLAARSGHTATTLAGGKVLLVGGEANNAQLATADLYDPSASPSEAWCAGNLAAARKMHTATLLDDGSVLVAGGQGPLPQPVQPLPDSASTPPVALAAAEVFVPVPGTGCPSGERWTRADPMSEVRYGHTATVLAGGKVLVVGGTGGPQGVTRLASAELYDPASRKWSTTGSLASPRSGHTATLLADGRALVAGGDDVSGATAELYDPATGTWSSTGSMLEGRSGHTASPMADAGIMVVGGGRTLAAEIYRPGTGRWEVAGRLHSARSGHTATAMPGGGIVVAGGTASGLIEIHPGAGGEWSPTIALAAPALPDVPRAKHTASLLADGRVMLAGGCGSECKSVEMLTVPVTVPGPSVTAVDPPAGPSAATTRVTVRGTRLSGVTRVRFGTVEVPLAAPASDRLVVVDAPAQAQGTVPVVLLHSAAGEVTGEAAVFTYGPGAWHPAGALGACGSGAGCGGRFLHAAAPLPGGRVLVAGGTTNFYDFVRAPVPGRDPRPLRTAEIYEHAGRSWRAAESMATARFAHTATALPDGRVLVAGGQDDQGNAVATAEVYDPGADPSDDSWAPAGSLSTPRFSHTATLLPDGRVLVAGGAVTEEQRYVPLAGAEIFDPRTGAWVSAGPMAVPRENHTATVLDGHRVLVAGGLTGPDADAPVPAPADATHPTLARVGVAVTPTAEIFDTRLGTWASAAPMSVGRYVHSATLLAGPRCLLPRPRAECGRVLVAGGGGGGSGGLDSAELFDPATGTWEAAPQMEGPAAGHSATLLPDGSVLVAGGGPLFPGDPLPGPLASAEVYNPAAGWRHTARLDQPRAGHSATLLPDGTVLAAGGYTGVTRDASGIFTFTLTDPAEVYTPAPDVVSLNPDSGPVGRRTPVGLTGTGFAGTTAVRFGRDHEAAGAEFTVNSPSAMVAVSPPRSARGAVEVTVDNAGGTSAHIEPYPTPRFTYFGDVGAVNDLAAEPVSATEIRLNFTPPDDGQGAPARSYVVVQQVGDLSPGDFDAATRLCDGGECRPAVNGTLLVTDLTPGTRYSYGLRAVGFDGVLGPVSNIASAVAGGRACPPIAEAATAPDVGRVVYPAGRYSLMGLPADTRVDADSPLYSWLDQGARGGYASQSPGDPVVAGQGYWAYFFCPATIDLAGGGAETASMPLGPYHASMIGNPSASSPARVTGQDFSARWESDAGGAGGYRISAYREADTLGVGEGSWVFTYSGAVVSISAG
ncbi:MAG TPA: kelch repeat-containing protein [Acidimicrobiales bacterium]|nr:kelch repeat-containing protein [Acidimicrobiales bacterium]